ncbi:hypothetical protein BFX80_06695 [Cobetia marina]|nr:hypothetical protein BFX80_06695 [Cobetia marina]
MYCILAIISWLTLTKRKIKALEHSEYLGQLIECVSIITIKVFSLLELDLEKNLGVLLRV